MMNLTLKRGDWIIAEYASDPMCFAGFYQGKMLCYRKDELTLFEIDEKAAWVKIP